MSISRSAAALHALRNQPLWQLLAATKAPAVVALLRATLFDGEQRLAASVLQERLGRALQDLRDAGEELPQTPAAYLADWLRQGWLQRPGEIAICAPNQVSVQIVGSQGAYDSLSY